MAKKKTKKASKKTVGQEVGVPEKRKKMRVTNLLTLKNIIIGIIAFLFITQYLQIQSIFGTFSFLEGRDSSLVTEIGHIKEAYQTFGDDMNEMRDYLRLPTKNYFEFESVDDVGEEKNENNLQLALFQYMTYLSDQKTIEKNIAENKSYLENLGASEEFQTFLGEHELDSSGITENEESFSLKILDKSGYYLIHYYLSKEDGILYAKTYEGKDEVPTDSYPYEDFEAELIKFLTEEKDNIINAIIAIEEKKSEISVAIGSYETLAEIKKLGISLTTETLTEGDEITYPAYNSSGGLVGKIVLNTSDLEISLIDVNDDSLTTTVSDISTALIPFLQKLDTRTFFEIKTQEAQESLRKTFEDEGFQLLLSQVGLTISEEAREDESRVYHDIYDSSGTHISSIVVEKTTGVINIVSPDGANSENILFFDPEDKKKTLEIPDYIPDYGDNVTHEEGTFNILIAGKHGNLVDTMIFTHIDETDKSIKMVSIPRDLYYNGRKINSFPYYYGMPELKRVLSELTGYELDKYILIDMYAFIDVVDLVGGVDVTLEKAVIDPTYRVVDDGVEGTLYYEPGDYHLGGVEALRLARSRHTSSDFARAERQQLILEALQGKAQNFGFGDADTIYAIAKTVLEQTETDIGLDDAIAYYFRYQGYEIQSNNVMSSGNVLYVPPYITTEDCNALIAEAEANGEERPGCENENNAYTLLPRNNDWNVVKWFFKENFEGETT